MNKNLLKVLTVGALVLTLSACNGKKNNGGDSPDTPVGPEGHGDYTIEEVFELDGAKFKYEGEEVTVKNVCVYSAIDKMLLVGYDGTQGKHPGTQKLKGFEVELETAPTWDSNSPTNGVYADVNVKGTLTDVNGRPVLKNGSVEINSEAYYDGEGNRTADGSQMSCGYYDLTNHMDEEALLEERDEWNGHFGRSASGVFIEAVFQVASKPTSFSADEASSFYLVFPGENTDGADEENEYRIYAELPAGLTRNVKSNAAGAQAGDKIPAYQWYENFFGTLSVGDYVLVDAMTRFDSTKGGMGLFMDQMFSIGYSEKTDPVEGIITTWAEIASQFEGKYTTDVPDLALEDQGVFSYGFSNLYANNVEDVWSEDSSWILVNHKTAGAFQAQFKCGMSGVESTREKLQTKLLAASYTLDTTVELEEGEFIYVLTEADVPVAEVLLVEASDYVLVTFIGLRPTEEFSTFAAACTALEAKASASASKELHIDMPELPTAVGEGLTNATLAWASEKDFEGVLQYTISLEFAAGTFTTDEAWEGFIDDMEASMISTSEYADGFEVPGLLAEGLCLETYNVLIEWDLDTDEDAEYCGATMYVFFDVTGTDDQTIFDCRADSVWDEDLYYLFAWYKLDAYGFGTRCYQGLATGEYVFDCSNTVTGLSFFQAAAQTAYLQKYILSCVPKCATEVTAPTASDAAGDPYLAKYRAQYVDVLAPAAGTKDYVGVYELNGSAGAKVKITVASYALGYNGANYCSFYIAFETVTPA